MIDIDEQDATGTHIAQHLFFHVNNCQFGNNQPKRPVVPFLKGAEAGFGQMWKTDEHALPPNPSCAIAAFRLGCHPKQSRVFIRQ